MKKIAFLISLFLLFSFSSTFAKDVVIFKKDLAKNLSVVSTEKTTTLYYKGSPISSTKNIIGQLEYAALMDHPLISKIVDINTPFEKLTTSQKSQLGKIFFKDYFYIFKQNPYSGYEPGVPTNTILVGTWVWEGPAWGGIIHQKSGKIYEFTHGITGIIQISEGKQGTYVMYDNGYEEPSTGLLLYNSSGEKRIPLKTLPLSGDPEIKNQNNYTLSYSYRGFELLLNKQIRIYYSVRDDGDNIPPKTDWKSYIISLK